MILLSSSLVIVSESAMAYSWSDDFSDSGLNPRWTKGGIGDIGISPEFSNLYAKSYDGDHVDDWHGPFIRTEIPRSTDFDISAQFRCIAMQDKISRVMIRVLDQSGSQIFSFGWSDIQAVNNKAEIGLYGSSFSSPIFKTESSFLYSIFHDKNISFTRSGQDISFYIDDSLVYNGVSNQTPAYFIDVAFLKYRNQCTVDVLEVNRISVITENAELPGVPENLDINPGDEYAYLSWSPPAYSGGLPITNYKIYRGDAIGNESYLTTIGNKLFYNDTGLTNDLEYYYKVSAMNSLGEGPSASVSVNLTTNTTVPPDDPPNDPVDPPDDNPVDDPDPIDRDDDGIEDNADAFPDDPAASVDTDDDGMPDDWNDGYDEEDSTSDLEVDIDDDNDDILDTEDPDDDNDGILDNQEDDITSWKDNFSLTSSIITVLALLIGIIIAMLFMRSGNNSESSKDSDDESKDSKSRKRKT